MSIKERIRRSVSGNKKETVFFKRDFAHLGSPRAVGEALRQLVEDGFLKRISSGIYAKTQYNSIGQKRVIIYPLGVLAARAMDRLGVKWSLGKMAALYSQGKINQIPQKDIFEIGSQKFSRLFSYNGRRVYFEKNGVIQREEK